MNSPSLDHVTDTVHHVTDTVQDVAHKVADRAPELASTVGRNARSTAGTIAETVSDAVVKLAYKAPFLDVPTPQRHRGGWMLRAALVVTIAGVVLWVVKRGRPTPTRHDVQDAPTREAAVAAERRLASAGN